MLRGTFVAIILLTFKLAISDNNIGNTRIIGGDEANIEQFPYQVSVIHQGAHTCGGVLVKPNLVLTAAHCLTGTEAEDFMIFVGTSELWAGEGQRFSVERIYRYPDFSSLTLENDIGALVLSEKPDLDNTVNIVELSDSDDDSKVGSEVLVSGYGATKLYGQPGNKLLSTKLTVISMENCKEIYRNSVIKDTVICAWSPDGRQDICEGDYGGPLTGPNGKLVGIIAWGQSCGRRGSPGVFTKISAYRDWIDSLEV